MEHLLSMQHFERIEYRPHDLCDAILGKWLATAREHLTKRFATIHAHCHVGGTVALPKTKHFHQRRMREASQHLGFVDETLEARVKR